MTRFPYKAPGRERGVMLILAMLIVVMVTTVAVAVSWRFELSSARNENRWHGAQARAYLEGAERLALKILAEDAAQTQLDHTSEPWADAGDALPTDEGWIQGQLEDAQGRFNLNLLAAQAPKQPNAAPEQRFTESQRRFIRLLQALDLNDGPMDTTQAMEITESVIDWIDADEEPFGFGGAERAYYDGLDPPYPISNEPMVSVSELSIIKGVTPEIYTKLLPHVIALPAEAKLNINTLSPLLMRTLNIKEDLLPLEELEIEAVIEERDAAGGYKDLSEFTSSPVVTSLLGDPSKFDATDLVLASNWFLFTAETLVGEQKRRSKSLMARPAGQPASVVRRTDANF